MRFGLFRDFALKKDYTDYQVFQQEFALVDEAERLGVDEVWLAEFHFLPDLFLLSAPLLIGSAIAARTQRIKIGLAVHVLPLSNPVRIAEEVATLDVISGGRVDLGMGRSTFPFVYDAYGLSYAESRGRFQECLDVMLLSWTKDEFSYDGEFYKLKNVKSVPKPFQKPYPPIRMGATGTETYEIVGRMGYPMLVQPVRGSTLQNLALGIREYRQAWKEAGHSGRPEVGLRVPVYVAKNAEQAYDEPRESTMRMVRRAAEAVATSIGDVSVSDDRRIEFERLSNITYDEVLEDMVVHGTPEVVVERLHQLEEDLGLDHVIYEVGYGGLIPYELQLNSLRLMMDKVVPAFN